MRTGDLVRPVRAGWSEEMLRNASYLDVWDNDSGGEIKHDTWAGKWEHDQVGVLLEGRRLISEDPNDPNTHTYTMVQVLLSGRLVWVVQEELEVVK